MPEIKGTKNSEETTFYGGIQKNSIPRHQTNDGLHGMTKELARGQLHDPEFTFASL
jgi:hypothetical protein